jgi:hypothetical protein
MGAAEYVKDVAEFVKKFNDIELNRRILKLEEEVIDLTRDKRRADDRVEELERALKLSKELVFKDPYYRVEGEPGLFCPACWDTKRIAARVVTVTHPVVGDQKVCPSCKHIYEGGRFT